MPVQFEYLLNSFFKDFVDILETGYVFILSRAAFERPLRIGWCESVNFAEDSASLRGGVAVRWLGPGLLSASRAMYWPH